MNKTRRRKLIEVKGGKLTEVKGRKLTETDRG